MFPVNGIDVMPARLTAFRIVVVCVVLAGAVSGIVVWWNTDLVSNQDALHQESYPKSGAFPVTPQSAGAVAPEQSGVVPSVVQPPVAGTGVGTPQLNPSPGDIPAAIMRAQETMGNPPSEAAGQSSLQGLSPEAAATVFKDAIKAASSSSAVSPFGRKQDKN